MAEWRTGDWRSSLRASEPGIIALPVAIAAQFFFTKSGSIADPV